MPEGIPLEDILSSGDESIYEITTRGPAPAADLPVTEQTLAAAPSGDVFGIIQNLGMGWDPDKLAGKQFVLLSTQAGIAGPGGAPVALGYHTGHYELGKLMVAAAEEFGRLGCIPFAAYCSDPCDGRTQGTPGMMDSLPYRNDAAAVFRRLARSLPTRSGVLGVATCDKGLPAMMMALASMRDLPSVLVPGGVTLPPEQGEDLGTVQSIGVRLAQGEVSPDYAKDMVCRACASSGGGCQFLGTAATSQVVAEALGLALPHSALAPSGQPIWLDLARRSARALLRLAELGVTTGDILTDAALRNAMTVYAAFGGSTNLLIHIPAIAYSAGVARPTFDDWHNINREVPRLVDALPNGPVGHPTVRVFLAGGVPEVMLHLRNHDLLDLDVGTVTAEPLGNVLNWWETSERRKRLRDLLHTQDGVDPDDVIMSPQQARRQGLTSTLTLPRGNLAPEGAVIKSTAIDRTLLDGDGVYRMTGPARVFIGERQAISAVKSNSIQPGDIIVLVCAGPRGSGMEEILQITGAVKHLRWGKHVAVITDGRFSGVSTGACIGHVGPEALAGGQIGKVLDGDIIQIVIDCVNLNGSVDLIGDASTPPEQQSVELGTRLLARRPFRSDLAPYADMPDDTRLWSVLQELGGSTWGGCVFDVDAITKTLEAGRRTLSGSDSIEQT